MINFETMPKCVAIVGSRSYHKDKKNHAPEIKMQTHVFRFIQKLGNTREIVSGGAIGIDLYAEVIADSLGNPFTGIFPDKTLPSPYRYFKRNRDIVIHVHKRGGCVVAFADPESWNGTRNTIKHCKEFEVPYLVLFFDANANYKGMEESSFGVHRFSST